MIHVRYVLSVMRRGRPLLSHREGLRWRLRGIAREAVANLLLASRASLVRLPLAATATVPIEETEEQSHHAPSCAWQQQWQRRNQNQPLAAQLVHSELDELP